MHTHHGTLRLLITLVTLIVLGVVVYLVLQYAMARTLLSIPTPVPPSTIVVKSMATSTPVFATSTSQTATSTNGKVWPVVTQADKNKTN